MSKLSPQGERFALLNFRCPPDMRAAIANLADKRRESVSAIVREAVASYIAAPPPKHRGHTEETSDRLARG